MGFVITIKTAEKVREVEQEWRKTSETGNTRDGGPVFEYVERRRVVWQENDLYRQTVEKLDLASVIEAVNKLK